MTKNQSYQDCKSCDSDNKFAKCKPKHSNPQNILLECGEGTGSRTFTSSDDSAFQLAYVTVDTTCLNKPKVIIKFSSIVTMVNLAEDFQEFGTVRLRYELFKLCESEEPKSIGAWIYEQVIVPLSTFNRQEESFSFMFCECTNCSKCCEYFVTVTPIEITNATATVSNGVMAALSQSLCDYPNNQCKVHDSKYNHRIEKHPKPKEILAICGSGNGSSSYRLSTELPPPPGISHATVDTTCLKNPKVLIEFSSNISLLSIRDIRLQFELFRVCGDGEPVSRGIWRFEKTGSVFGNDFVEKIFSFIFCECKAPSSCCEYFVILTVNELNADFDLIDVTIDNARMSAFAQESSDCSNNDDYKTDDEKDDYIDCIPKHPKPKKIILECGSGVGSRRFTQSSTERFQVGQVTIDTTCLCKPLVNIEFSSIIGFEIQEIGPDIVPQLQIELFRVCDNRSPVPIGVWVLENLDQTGRITNAFHVIACDCTTCPGCCDYFITATPFGTTGSENAVTVSDVRIAALAQEG